MGRFEGSRTRRLLAALLIVAIALALLVGYRAANTHVPYSGPVRASTVETGTDVECGAGTECGP
jgi:hypothetical protein